MGTPKEKPLPHIEVENPQAAIQKMQELAGRVIKVPKAVTSKAKARRTDRR